MSAPDAHRGTAAVPPGEAARIESAARLLRAAASITVLTGAGISTDSGIPDFRGPQGVWTRDPGAAQRATLQAYLEDPSLRRESWQNRRAHAAWAARPNAAHRALVDLERAGRLRAVVTQNIDGLHLRAGHETDRVIEVHGTLRECACLSCGDRTPMQEALDRVDAGEPDPPCRRCGGILKSATISFGQSLDPAVFRAAARAASECDLLVVVGSSLTVNPAAHLVRVAVDSGAALVIINAMPTPYDALAQVVVREPISTAVPAVTRASA